MGQPLESTAAVEALACGCIFINPQFDGNETQLLQHMNKPTSRHVCFSCNIPFSLFTLFFQLNSQVTYLTEQIGPPQIITVNISNKAEVSTVFNLTKGDVVSYSMQFCFNLSQSNI
jgi:hypothetical protein